MDINKRVAFVVDALPFRGGAERVLEAAIELFPGAPIYTHIFNKSAFQGSRIEDHPVICSFINRLPLSRRYHRSYLPFYPLATEQFDLSPYDLILSFSYAVAHGILTTPGQMHLSYRHTVMRHAWHGYKDFLRSRQPEPAATTWVARVILHYFRNWDASTGGRVDRYFAASDWVARLVKRVYQREARVIYPPVDINAFLPHRQRDNYYLAVSRLEPHKRVDILLEAFGNLGYPLLVIGDGSMRKHLQGQAATNVKLLGRVIESELHDYMGRAKAFVHAAVEDFGIAAVEAQAAGCPVIAFGAGGLNETIIDGETGILYGEQSAESLMQAVADFERGKYHFSKELIRNRALLFNKERFLQEYYSAVEMAIKAERTVCQDQLMLV